MFRAEKKQRDGYPKKWFIQDRKGAAEYDVGDVVANQYATGLDRDAIGTKSDRAQKRPASVITMGWSRAE